MDLAEVGFEEWKDHRSYWIGFTVVLLATMILSAITANECHSTFVSLNRQVPYEPSLLFGFAMWAWWGALAIALWVWSLRHPEVLAFRTTSLGLHMVLAVVLGACHLALIQTMIGVASSVWNTWGALYAGTNYLSIRRFGMELVIYGFIYGVSGFLYTHMQRTREVFTLMTNDQLTRMLRSLQSNGRPPQEFMERFLVKDADKEILLSVERIDWIEAAEYYCCLHVEGKSFLLRESITNMEKRLDPRKFLRIHRSTIVRLDKIREIHRESQTESSVVLSDGRTLRMSRTGRQRLTDYGQM